MVQKRITASPTQCLTEIRDAIDMNQLTQCYCLLSLYCKTAQLGIFSFICAISVYHTDKITTNIPAILRYPI